MSEADQDKGSSKQIILDESQRVKRAKDRLEGVELDPQVKEDLTTVAIADYKQALQEGMDDLDIPMSMRIAINKATKNKLPDQNSE